MSSTEPSSAMSKGKMRAVWSIKDTLSHVELDIISPEAEEVLIRNVYVASNPKDWKFPRWVEGYESVEGNDVAGYVEQVGPDVTAFKPGDRVAALTKQKTHRKFGAYQEFSIAPASTTFHIGTNTTFEQAVTLPLSFTTAALALYHQLKLPLPFSTSTNSNSVTAPHSKPTLIVNGAASSVGAYATQLALRSGYRVVGIAGNGADFAKTLGCSDIVDYRNKSDEIIGAEVLKLAPEAQVAIDCVSAGSSPYLLSLCLGDKGGTICTLLPTVYDRGATVRNSIGLVKSEDHSTAAHHIIPENITLTRALIFDAHADAETLTSELLKQLAGWVDRGQFQTMSSRIIPNGLHGIPEGLKLLELNQVSAQKCIYRISDTPVATN